MIKEIENSGLFDSSLPLIIGRIKDTIAGDIPERMKVTLALSEIMLFASQFRKNILHWNGSRIPINSITFCIADSGVGKDSTIASIRRNFEEGYKLIEEKRVALANNKAIELAKVKYPNTYESNWKKFYTPPTPLFVASSTNEGFIKHLNALEEDCIGAGYIYSGELASELLNGSNIQANFQLLSELYDMGKKEPKMLKDSNNQSKAIKNLPVSGLFITSPDILFYDNEVKRKFKLEFSSKLARRSFFNYNKVGEKSFRFDTLNDYISIMAELEDNAIKLAKENKEIIKDVTRNILESSFRFITIPNETRNLILMYDLYSQEKSSQAKEQFQLTKLTLRHSYWRALKLSGALALLRGSSEIAPIDYKEAIYIVELLNEDILDFEKELVKEGYEFFIQLVHSDLDESGKCFMPLHILKKLGFINSSKGIKELVNMSNSADKSGVYKLCEDGIRYTKSIPTENLGVSYLKCSGNKEQRVSKCSKGFSFTTTTFDKLKFLLQEDYAYTPFEFINGERSNSTIVGGIKWIALDIDKSGFSDYELHNILKDYNHHIVRTSNPENPFKFRLLLELDTYVELNEREYKEFLKNIAKVLAINIDILPKSQIFFSYKGREIYSVVDKNKFETRELLIQSESKEVEVSKLSAKQKSQLLDNRFETFKFAFNAPDGTGSISLIRAGKYAKDLGMSKDEVIELLDEINNYWVIPMESNRFQSTILNQVERWFE